MCGRNGNLQSTENRVNNQSTVMQTQTQGSGQIEYANPLHEMQNARRRAAEQAARLQGSRQTGMQGSVQTVRHTQTVIRNAEFTYAQETEELREKWQEKSVGAGKRRRKSYFFRSALYKKRINAETLEKAGQEALRQREEEDVRLPVSERRDAVSQSLSALYPKLEEKELKKLTGKFHSDFISMKEFMKNCKKVLEDCRLTFREIIEKLDGKTVNFSSDEALVTSGGAMEEIVRKTRAFRCLLEKDELFASAFTRFTQSEAPELKTDFVRVETVCNYYRVRKLLIQDPYYRTHYNSEIPRYYKGTDGEERKRVTTLLYLAAGYRERLGAFGKSIGADVWNADMDGLLGSLRGDSEQDDEMRTSDRKEIEYVEEEREDLKTAPETLEFTRSDMQTQLSKLWNKSWQHSDRQIAAAMCGKYEGMIKPLLELPPYPTGITLVKKKKHHHRGSGARKETQIKQIKYQMGASGQLKHIDVAIDRETFERLQRKLQERQENWNADKESALQQWKALNGSVFDMLNARLEKWQNEPVSLEGVTEQRAKEYKEVVGLLNFYNACADNFEKRKIVRHRDKKMNRLATNEAMLPQENFQRVMEKLKECMSLVQVECEAENRFVKGRSYAGTRLELAKGLTGVGQTFQEGMLRSLENRP